MLIAQGVAINTDGEVADVSSMLDVKATNKGILVPRISIPNLSAAAPVTSPATSLLVYNTNAGTGVGYYYWSGSAWIKLFTNADVHAPKWSGNNNTTDAIGRTGNVGIGTTSPGQKLDVQSGNLNVGALYGTYVMYGTLGSFDTRATNPNPEIYNMGVTSEFKGNAANGLSDGGTYNSVLTVRNWSAGTDWSGGGVHQMGFTANGNIWHRYSQTTGVWGPWRKLYDSASGGLITCGTANYVVKSDGSNGVCSQIYDNGTNVGIGTASPTTKVTIAGGHGDTKLRLYSTGNGSDQPSNLSLWASEPGVTYFGTGIGYNVNGHPFYGRIDATRGAAYVRFLPAETKFEFINSAGSTINNVMVVKETGRVGIGTDAPAEVLSVTTAIAGWQSRFNNSSGSGADVYLAHNGGYGMHIRGWNATDGIYTLEMYNNTSLTNAFYNSGRVALGMVGNVGVGNAAPSQKLHVTGNLRVTGAYYDSNNTPGTSGQVLSSTATGTTWIKGQIIQTNSASVTAGNWYRIASNPGNRADATFTLRDFISGGGHSTLRFHAGINYGDAGGISFTLLNHSRYGTTTFTKVRIIRNSTYDGAYLEVYCARSGDVEYDMFDNYQSSGWVPVDWTAGSIPGGWTAHEYETDRLFAVGVSDDVLSLTRGGYLGVGTASPTYRLESSGDIYANGGWMRVSGNQGYYFESWGGGFYMVDGTWIRTYNNKSFYHNTGIMRTDGTFQVGGDGSTLNVPNGGNFAYRTNVLFANTSGNVGIGTASPGYRLDLAQGTFAFGNSNQRTESRDNAGLQGNAGAQSGFFETASPSNYPAGASSWWHLIDCRHSNTGNNYAMQLAGSFFDQRLYFRKTNNNAAQPWVEITTAATETYTAVSLTSDYIITNTSYTDIPGMTLSFTAKKSSVLVMLTASGHGYTNSMSFVNLRIWNNTTWSTWGGTSNKIQSYDNATGTVTVWSLSYSKLITGLTVGATYSLKVQGRVSGILGVDDAVIYPSSDPDAEHLTLTVFY